MPYIFKSCINSAVVNHLLHILRFEDYRVLENPEEPEDERSQESICQKLKQKIKRENFIRNIHGRTKKIDDLNYENFYGRYDEGQ